MDVLIVGGGIIGLLLAKELLQKSVSVTVLDRQAIGKEASWAGGGIVSPLYPWNYQPCITALASWAQEAYPDLAEELAAETGIDPEFNQCGLLMLDPPDRGKITNWAERNDKRYEVIDGAETHALEPALGSSEWHGVWWPDIGNVRNPRLLKSLEIYLQRHSECKLIPECQVTRFEQSPGGRVAVVANEQRYQADKVVVCAGAWSNQVLNQLGIELPIEPVRGQMLVFEPSPGLINGIILHQGRYLIPRLDGRIVVGSTLEYTGYDKSTTTKARQELLASACQLVPALDSIPVEAHWAGLRPGSPHGIPFIGEVPGFPNLYLNAGHFRNGLVLAPASARLMRNILLGEAPIVDPVPYGLDVARQSLDYY
ncbi:MAG: glycine oxidase ThiO [Pseudomonadales bacterium]|jgi:glycine oxidase|nr:glycine oxidase ThiO [Pseudomonadales bacterium]MEC8810447.1 glycine oxidase ThiO [Pseudomonadota bacterium]HAG96038.1 glycine oxidase ThiO [Gammaproteobacteria bacterium]MAQ27055.1 glycine oxidase ThiO [Pseudomonadales bacterium]HAU15577.1 glycine oxidase ThiO [Gammaproteobacteria bacterium]|tara:strand:- start:2262 stop:3368 length:1107 start_codon:yes stop_codon:yes gene_type:complete